MAHQPSFTLDLKVNEVRVTSYIFDSSDQRYTLLPLAPAINLDTEELVESLETVTFWKDSIAKYVNLDGLRVFYRSDMEVTATQCHFRLFINGEKCIDATFDHQSQTINVKARPQFVLTYVEFNKFLSSWYSFLEEVKKYAV